MLDDWQTFLIISHSDPRSYDLENHGCHKRGTASEVRPLPGSSSLESCAHSQLVTQQQQAPLLNRQQLAD